jgi:hypothetical protein
LESNRIASFAIFPKPIVPTVERDAEVMKAVAADAAVRLGGVERDARERIAELFGERRIVALDLGERGAQRVDEIDREVIGE